MPKWTKHAKLRGLASAGAIAALVAIVGAGAKWF
jgi:hypothetical protein